MATAKGIEIWRGQVRMPAPMFDWVKGRAEKNYRSVNAEFVELVREMMAEKPAKDAP